MIITGVDGSETARQAARTAARLAVRLGADLQLLSAYGSVEVERVNAHGKTVVIDHKRRADETVGRIAVELGKEFPELNISSRSAMGKPATALVDAAEELSADLIVVGNKRVQGVARVLGSVAAEVARHAPCDVYIAHTHQHR